MMTTERRRLTEPLETITRLFGTLLLLLLAISVAATLFGSGSIGGFGNATVCVTQPNTGYGGFSTAHLGVTARPGAYLDINGQLQVCASHPSFGQRALYTLTDLPSTLLWAAILLMLWLVIRAAARTGPFTLPVAAAMRRLGWLILVGSAAVGAAQGAALDALLNSMLTAQNDFGQAATGAFSVVPVPLLAGAALLTFARIIRLGAVMDDELQGTV